jgi:hypothetical protein
MPRQWTDQQRAAQAERCRKQQPWKHSTGPKSVAGKRKVAQNSRKPASLELANAIRAESWRRYDEGDYDGYMTKVTMTDTGSCPTWPCWLVAGCGAGSGADPG